MQCIREYASHKILQSILKYLLKIVVICIHCTQGLNFEDQTFRTLYILIRIFNTARLISYVFITWCGVLVVFIMFSVYDCEVWLNCGLMGSVFRVLVEVGVCMCVCVCTLTTKLKHIIPKSHACRLQQNIHTFNCYLYNICRLSYDLMPSSICRSHTLHKKQYVVAQVYEIDVGWFIKNNKQIKTQ